MSPVPLKLVVSTHLKNIHSQIMSNWIISPGRDENKKYLKPPPSKTMSPVPLSTGEGPDHHCCLVADHFPNGHGLRPLCGLLTNAECRLQRMCACHNITFKTP